MPVILLLSGPNLNLLGEREPEIYGTTTLADLVAVATEAAVARGHDLEHLQSNHEGDVVEAIHAAPRAVCRDRDQRGCLHALLVCDRRRAGHLRRREDRVAHLQPGGP